MSSVRLLYLRPHNAETSSNARFVDGYNDESSADILRPERRLTMQKSTPDVSLFSRESGTPFLENGKTQRDDVCEASVGVEEANGKNDELEIKAGIDALTMSKCGGAGLLL